MKVNSRIIYFYIIALVIGLSACTSESKNEVGAEEIATDETLVVLTPQQEKNIDLFTDSLRVQNMSSVLKLSGQVDVPPQNLVSVSIPLGGYLKSSQMLPGTQVRKGQLLAILEDPQYIQLQQDYLSVKNKLLFAGKEYERQKELNSTKASSDKVLQQAENEYRSLNIESKAIAAKLALIGINTNNLSENNISKSINIYSPINGYINKVNVNIGKYVTPSDVIFELINPEDIHLNLNVYEKDLSKIAIGQKVLAFTNSLPNKKHETEVILISHSLNENRSTEVHCHFEKYDKSLVPGMYMNAEISLNQVMEKVLPDEAIVSFENKDYVFMKESEHHYRMTEVKKGQSENGFTVIENDLSKKMIVIKGAYSLLMQLKNIAE